jgi:hypothetical protein
MACEPTMLLEYLLTLTAIHSMLVLSETLMIVSPLCHHSSRYHRRYQYHSPLLPPHRHQCHLSVDHGHVHVERIQRRHVMSPYLLISPNLWN